VENTNTVLTHNSDIPVPREFFITLKIGVYKELFNKGLLTKEQLDALITLQKNASVLTEEK